MVELTLSYTYSEGQFLPPEDPETRDTAVIVGAKQDDAGKSILSQFVQALEHACEDQEGVWEIIKTLVSKMIKNVCSHQKRTICNSCYNM